MPQIHRRQSASKTNSDNGGMARRTGYIQFGKLRELAPVEKIFLGMKFIDIDWQLDTTTAQIVGDGAKRHPYRARGSRHQSLR